MGRTVKVVLDFEQRQIILVLTLVTWIPCLSMWLMRPKMLSTRFPGTIMRKKFDLWSRERSTATHVTKLRIFSWKRTGACCEILAQFTADVICISRIWVMHVTQRFTQFSLRILLATIIGIKSNSPGFTTTAIAAPARGRDKGLTTSEK